MLRLSIIFVLVICYRLSVIGQAVIIKGKADSTYLSSSNTIYAYTNDDYISYKEKELATSLLDAKGNFSLSFSISEPTYVYLTIDNAKAEMVCEPGKTYDITFLAKDSDAVNTLSIAVPAVLQFNNSNETELNYLMADFSDRFEAFLEDHRGMITKKEKAIFGKIDTLKVLFKNKYTAYNNSYLNNHIEYRFASLEESISLHEGNKIYKEYIEGKPVQHGNYDYMKFFHEYHSLTVENFMSNSRTQFEINSKQTYASLYLYFKSVGLAGKDSVRSETSLLKCLSEYYRFPEIKTKAVIEILSQASKQCKSEANRKSAENLKKKFSAVVIGKPVSPPPFLDTNGKPFPFSNLKGKYVYINFWTSWCSSCTQEMALLPELKKLYGTKIAFVSICVDKNPEAMQNFLKKNPKLDWTFLYCDNYKKAKEAFNLLTVPAYYMLDPKGNFYKVPAPSPSDTEMGETTSQLEKIFMKIKKKQQ